MSAPVRLLKIEIWVATLIPARLGLPVLGATIGWPAVILACAMFGLWFLGTGNGDGDLQRNPPVRVVVAGFWTSLLVSYSLLHLHAVPGVEARNADRYLILCLAVTGIALTAAEGLRTPEDVIAVLRTQVAAVSVMCAIALIQFRLAIDPTQYLAKVPLLETSGTLVGILGRNGFGRPAGTASHPIEFGVVVAITVGPAIYLFIHDRARSLYRRGAQLGAVGLGVPMSISRSALLATMIIVGMWVAVLPLRRRLAAFAGIFVLSIAVFLTTPGLIGTLRSFVVAGQADSSISTRTSDYAAIAPLLRAAPWFGRGPGTFLPDYRVLDNQYLLTLIEQGLVGFAALVFFYIAALFLGRGARLHARDQAEHELGQCLAAPGVAMVAIAMTFDAMSFPLYALHCGLALGLAGGYYQVLRTARKAQA